MSKYLYAIVKSGKREYKVTPGKVIIYERLDAEPGDSIELDQVSQLVNGEDIINGEPIIEGARVHARVIKHESEMGIIVFRLKRRMLFHRKSKHRHSHTKLKIEEIIIDDVVFNKSDTDPRKIKKAQAAARKSEADANKQAKLAKQKSKTKSASQPTQSAPKVSPPMAEKNDAPKQHKYETTLVAKEKNEKSVRTESVTIQPPTIEKKSKLTNKQCFEELQPNRQKEIYSNIQSNKIWRVIVVLLLIALLFYFWYKGPTPALQDDMATISKPLPADIDLRNTQLVDNPNTPVQPPD